MSIELEINGVDRTGNVVWQSLQKSDVLNEKVDTLTFSVNKYGSSTFEPAAGDTVELFDTGTTIFKGLILTVTKTTEGHSLVRFDVNCVDNTHYLNRVLVAESYAGLTIEEIIEEIVTTYAPTFTTANVDAPVEVESITFNRVSVTEAIGKLAKLSNYSWYVDYDNDIHFFEKNTEPAPFNITDTSNNYIFESLEVSHDLSQLRNRVFIQGGEAEGEVRTEEFDGDGDKKFFKLSNKFSSLPTVTVGGVSKTVGVDFLDDEEDFDALWNYNEKYIKFTTAPAAGTSNVDVTGVPLYNILVQVEDAASIIEYGVAEFARTDTSISSREEARAFGIAELEAYANQISDGSFSTYTPGLRSGQLINVNSTLRGINEDFLIQRVTFQMVSQDVGFYRVELATLKTITLIDLLITQLRQNGRIEISDDNILLQKYVTISETASIGETFTAQALNYAVSARLAPQAVSGTLRPFNLNGARVS